MNSKMVKEKVLPKGWRKIRIIDFSPLQRGFDLPANQIKEGPYPVVYSNGIKNYHSEYKSKAPGVVTGRSGTIGEVTYVSEDYWPHNTSLWVTDFKGNHPKFVFYCLKHLKTYRFNAGSGVPTLNRNDLHKQSIFSPPFPEQKAIASLLETWDTAIEKTEALIAAKEKRFKWLLKTLISDQWNNPEWQKVRLGDVGSTFSGLSGKSKEDFGKGKPYITYLNIYQNSSINISQVGLCSVGANENQNRIIKGDVFFTTSSETSDEVGVSSILLQDMGECYLNSFCFGWRRNQRGEGILSDNYLEHFFRSVAFRKQTIKISQGATRYNLSKRYLMKTWIVHPNIREQRLIAAQLNAVQKEIIIARELSEQYRAQKRGLMQKLLTGKWSIAE